MKIKELVEQNKTELVITIEKCKSQGGAWQVWLWSDGDITSQPIVPGETGFYKSETNCEFHVVAYIDETTEETATEIINAFIADRGEAENHDN